MFSFFKFRLQTEAIQLAEGSIPCKFCNISPKNGFKIVWEDDTFVAFEDIRPAAMHHLQITPKKHIESVKALNKFDVDMVRSMEELGNRILDDLGVPTAMRKLGFHIPPFNSVNHLHMHVQGLPYRSFVRGFKYPIVNGGGSHQKGFSWFAEAGQTIRILERGGSVGIFPS
ncbi:hypothetical protein PILCRDRAFT_817891 [Piloderma croceum F 1598]|uniref:HIT domain-containing protein n=1 Tax=Piloderma croceum (strain F 1598) TaxID=765440 RepID=A0A0C3BFH8_PILCF|nr:hypothetical protein PILCRDRAFT_817891 [Piloderma croceum F 1598]